ncbi:hypothetical protein AG0111_0g1258 [Alternaria gaisen]|uniref:Uncharacterized protein n=1 Tax=Alternaria gaisen TaxID=167740 RepID=A0ACB6G4F5_9PLEO|nr:hypothetical protein AG0111_0g1258 [Alternaria gaisen]
MGYTLPLDRVGWTYITIFIIWNILTFTGVSFLWAHRKHPSVRMRRLPVLFAGIGVLHIYGSLCCLAYPIGPAVPCSVEFWMMSITVPLGMALFHASNSQFLHLASRQKQFARMSSLKDHEPIDEKKAQEVVNSRWKRIMNGVERADNIERTLIFIGVGMAVQLALVLFVFFASEKFHHGYGIINYTVQGTGGEVRANCSKGWEWWLSIVWQLFWSWIYAPWILFKSRGIRDVHGWRLQTIICCIAGLPASPLWLIGLYTPSFAPMNAVFPPPVWFAVCFCIMEICTIAFPIIDVLRSNRLRQETLDAIANWEARQATANLEVASTDAPSKSPSEFSSTTTLKSGGEVSVGDRSFDSQKSDILTMTALENALRSNAMPLLQFAALKDFSGENVSFLTHVSDWRLYWFSPKSSIADHRRKQFLAATRIYAHFISLEFSEFPINISSKEMKRLHIVFERTAKLLFGRRLSSDSSSSSEATPFDNVMPDDASDSPINDKSNAHISANAISLDRLGRANLKAVSRLGELYGDESVIDVDVPDSFNELVFDAAESEIKYLVLTNTWPKFVNVSRANSQLSKDEDEEKGNAFMRKLLCA